MISNPPTNKTKVYIPEVNPRFPAFITTNNPSIINIKLPVILNLADKIAMKAIATKINNVALPKKVSTSICSKSKACMNSATILILSKHPIEQGKHTSECY